MIVEFEESNWRLKIPSCGDNVVEKGSCSWDIEEVEEFVDVDISEEVKETGKLWPEQLRDWLK